MTPPILEMAGVDAGYGAYRALFDVSFRLERGRAMALLGPNGSGKTTVARVCTGLVHPTVGAVLIDGHDVAGAPPHTIARMGVVHAVEGRSVFATLTVAENLELTLRPSVGKGGLAVALDKAYEAFPILGERRKQQAATLSGGEQRMLALARALAAPPRLLVVDELSLGLAPVVVDQLYDTLRKLKWNGTSLLIVEQHVVRALTLADDAVLLAKGRVTYAGPSADLGDRARELTPNS